MEHRYITTSLLRYILSLVIVPDWIPPGQRLLDSAGIKGKERQGVKISSWHPVISLIPSSHHKRVHTDV
jgi:hypothetical protein